MARISLILLPQVIEGTTKGQWNDDEDAVASALQEVESIADLCALNKRVTGGLLEFLNDLTDSPDEWKMFTRPLAGMIEDTEVTLTPQEQEMINENIGKYLYVIGREFFPNASESSLVAVMAALQRTVP